MRTSYEGFWLETEDDPKQVFGVCLGSDYVAEHEWGIKRIRDVFPDTSPEQKGPEARKQIAYDPDQWVFFTSRDKKKAILVFEPGYHSSSRPKTFKEASKQWIDLHEPYEGSKNTFGAAWAGDSFGIFAVTPEDVKHLQALYQAAQDCQLCVWITASQPFKNGGLCVADLRRFPVQARDLMVQADTERQEFNALVAKVEQETDITARLKAAGFSWYALSPSTKMLSHLQTSYPLIYFLNPARYKGLTQKDLYCGWVTIERLEQFLAGDETVLLREETK